MEDTQIIELFLQRDPDALDALNQKYGAYCMTVALNILGNPQDAEECVNDAFLGIWNIIPPHKPENLATFSGKIVRNAAFNRYRNDHAQKRGGSTVPLVLDELSDVLPDPNTIEAELDKKAFNTALNQFINSLPKWKRYVLIRRYWYADSISEIAKNCGKSESYISMVLTRLRRKLKTYLNERGICCE